MKRNKKLDKKDKLYTYLFWGAIVFSILFTFFIFFMDLIEIKSNGKIIYFSFINESWNCFLIVFYICSIIFSLISVIFTACSGVIEKSIQIKKGKNAKFPFLEFVILPFVDIFEIVLILNIFTLTGGFLISLIILLSSINVYKEYLSKYNRIIR